MPYRTATPKTLDEAVRNILQAFIPPQHFNETMVTFGVAVLTDYLNNKMTSEIIKRRSMSRDLIEVLDHLLGVTR